MAMVLHLAHLVVLGAGEAEPKPSIGTRRQTLERLAGEMEWLPDNLMGGFSALAKFRTVADGDKARQQLADLRMLIEKADTLPEDLLHVKDPSQRGLAALVFGLSNSPKKIAVAVKCLNDDTVTAIASLPYTTQMYGSIPRKEDRKNLTVGVLARMALRYRLVGFGLQAGHPFTSNKDAAQYWENIDDIETLPSEWVYRFRRARGWGKDVVTTKKELLERVRPAHVGILVASVRAFVPSVYTDEEVTQVLARSGDRKLLRGILEQTLRRPGISLKYGPNSTHQRKVRQVLLRVAPKVFAKEDAQWVYDATDPKEWVSVYYIIAAAELDPEKGVDWLKEAIKKDGDQLRRCKLLEALWSVGGESQISYIKDRYFADSKPKYNAGGLQENLIERFGKNGGEKAAPLLKALVLDRRFTTLGWAAMRAFAKNAAVILGEETKEVKRYLGVKHRMGVYDFEQQPKGRDKYLVDTKHVLMQTEAFQIYLQGEVLKRSQKDDGTE